MTNRRTVSYALSLTRIDKWGTPVRIVELIASHSESSLDRAIEISPRNIATWLGISVRTVARALTRLTDANVLEVCEVGAGTRATSWRIRDPELWSAESALVPWALDREEIGIRLGAHKWSQVRALDGSSARSQARALGLFKRGDFATPEALSARTQLRAQGKSNARTQLRALAGDIDHVYEDSSNLPLNEDDEETLDRITQLHRSIERTTGELLYGPVFEDLKRLTRRMNGSFEAALKIAERAGTDGWRKRLEQIRVLVDNQWHELAAAPASSSEPIEYGPPLPPPAPPTPEEIEQRRAEMRDLARQLIHRPEVRLDEGAAG